MPFFDFDEMAKKIEPIRFRFRGTEYEIKNVSLTVSDRVIELVQQFNDGEISNTELVLGQLEAITGLPKETFEGIDAQVAKMVISKLTDAITQLDEGGAARKKRRR